MRDLALESSLNLGHSCMWRINRNCKKIDTDKRAVATEFSAYFLTFNHFISSSKEAIFHAFKKFFGRFRLTKVCALLQTCLKYQTPRIIVLMTEVGYLRVATKIKEKVPQNRLKKYFYEQLTSALISSLWIPSNKYEVSKKCSKSC